MACFGDWKQQREMNLGWRDSGAPPLDRVPMEKNNSVKSLHDF